jgi:hypothetical protein
VVAAAGWWCGGRGWACGDGHGDGLAAAAAVAVGFREGGNDAERRVSRKLGRRDMRLSDDREYKQWEDIPEQSATEDEEIELHIDRCVI